MTSDDEAHREPKRQLITDRLSEAAAIGAVALKLEAPHHEPDGDVSHGGPDDEDQDDMPGRAPGRG
jgi:hypothetical protein